jgi:hypothetical protein
LLGWLNKENGMGMYIVTVKRMQVWNIEVEADDRDSAIEKAENEADHESPHDDYAYETRVKLK